MLSNTVLGVDFENPLVLASGILGTSSDILIRIAESGAGAVTMKSIGPVERTGNLNPNLIDFGCGMLNAIGLPSPGYKNVNPELEELKKSPSPVIASVYGSTIQDFVDIVTAIKPFYHVPKNNKQTGSFSAIELDISCPNKDDGLSFSASSETAYELVSNVKKVAGDIPIIPKLTPNTHSIPLLADACKRAGADALCAINTASGMVINIDARKPVLAYKKGGVSGPALKPIAVRCVYEAYEKTKLPIIGTGGVTTGADAIEMIMAGASLVGVGTAVYYRGMNVFQKIKQEMELWMKENNVFNLSEIRGVAHE